MATIEEMFAQYLQREAEKDAAAQKAAEVAAQAEAESKFVTKADLEGAFTAFGEALGAKIAEEVAKAMPVVRPEGAGRQGETQEQEDPFQADPIAHVVKKARGERTPEEKDFIWTLTKKVALRPEEMSIGS